MKRISKQAKAIADAHIRAAKEDSFDDPSCRTRDEVIAALKDGKTLRMVLEAIEFRFASVGSIMLSRVMDYTSQSYKAAVYKGFRILIDGEKPVPFDHY